jgi:hypothetical protein
MGLSVSLVSIFLTTVSQVSQGPRPLPDVLGFQRTDCPQCSSVFSASVATFLADIAWIFPTKYAARYVHLGYQSELALILHPVSC